MELGGAPQLFIPLIRLPNFKDIDLSSFKLVSSGAAPLALPVLVKMLNAFSGTVCEAYGMAECTMDADGYFYITERQKDMIIYKGYNVYPRELEEVLFTHPDVAQCAVIGKPGMEVGEAPVAFVQLMPEVVTSSRMRRS
jgi:acyl-CoA synthetase (AMP-forming)/AMP-acid ligase II